MSIIDKAAFIGMNGAGESLRQMQIISNNLANLNTPAFRADNVLVKPYNNKGNGMDARIYSNFDKTYSNFKHGLIYNTGRDLDLALTKEGFIAVQSREGKEGYTRAGNLQLNAQGFLTTERGELVLGSAGPIQILNAEKVHIGDNGNISALLQGSPQMVNLDRIKLVNPPINQLEKGHDGLFYLGNGQAAQEDNNVKVISGSLEGSNVNMIETLTSLIDQSRDYQAHTSLIKTLSEDSSVANQILELPR